MNIQILFLSMAILAAALASTANADSQPEVSLVTPAIDQTERPPTGDVVTDTEKYEIAEQYFRDDILHWVSNTFVRVFFLAIDGEDPPSEFLLRFSDIDAAVVKGITAHDPEALGRAVDRVTRAEGVILRMSNFRKTSSTRILVDVGHYQDMQSASGATRVYELKNGKWKYAGYEGMMWIS